MNYFRSLFLISWLLLMSGCQTTATPRPSSMEKLNSPTISAMFQQAAATATPQPTKTSIPTTAAPVKTKQTWEDILLVPVFSDELDPDWQLLENRGMTFDPASSDTVYRGKNSIKVSPQRDYGQLFFAIPPETRNVYPRMKTVGLSLWINGGENAIGFSSLAFAITGSNIYPYWDDLDRSTYINGEYPFSETRLYYLGFNREIPPNTWVKIELLMEQLIFDPYYEYVTGFYIKNDEDFYNPFYVDEVNWMMLEGGPEPLSIRAATATPELTLAPTLLSTLTRTPTQTKSATLDKAP